MTHRSRILFLTSTLLSLTLSMILFKPIFAQPEHFAATTEALQLIDAVNALRDAKQLPPYQVNNTLMVIAQSQADYMAGTGVLTHFDASGLRPYQRAGAAGYLVAGDLSQGGLFLENIHSAKNMTVAEVVDFWQADPINMKTLFSTELQNSGAGIASINGLTYYVLDASSTADAADKTSTPAVLGTKPAVITSTPNDDGSIYHVVQPKEALWSIALAYNMTIDDLKKLNRLSTNDIFEGQKLLIFKPKAGPTITPTTGVTFTATFGIPTSTATQPGVPTVTFTATPQPTPPASRKSGEIVVGFIVLAALLAAGMGSWLGRNRK